jgi:hypothetical protein
MQREPKKQQTQDMREAGLAEVRRWQVARLPAPNGAAKKKPPPLS